LRYSQSFLRDFYHKNFLAAAENFTKAALKDEENVSENWRLAGNSQMSAYEFREAVKSYGRALNLTPNDEQPERWAGVINLMGVAKNELSEIAEGEEGLRALLESIEAFKQALQVYTREQSPERWAMTHTNLATVIVALADRTEGDESMRLLDEAVKAFKLALEVRTREYLPKEWAMTQTSLGAALRQQGRRMDRDEGVRLLNEAVAAYRQAIRVYTRQRSPEDWATVQNNLGKEQELMVPKARGCSARQSQLTIRRFRSTRARSILSLGLGLSLNWLKLSLS
jgi:tetratricopeptide (TPR) repeat protein